MIWRNRKPRPANPASASPIVGNKVISAREQLDRSKARDFKDLDFPVPTRPWSSSFSGASHPPEPVDTDLMRHVYVPIDPKNPDSGSLMKSMSHKGPFLDDLSLRVPPNLVEKPNDLNSFSSPFLVSRASQNTEASLLPESDEKECVWDTSVPPSPLSRIDST